MANPNVTYTFTNGTVADASQVMQNFTDLINGLTDGSKSLNVDAITAAGTATLNGDSVIGNASGDASTVNATMTFAATPKVDVIAEKTSAAGVIIDGLLLKDNGIFGRTDGITIPTGYVGENLTATGSAATNVTTYTTIATLTLTTGAWLVSAGFYSDNGPTQTGGYHQLFIKGVTSATIAKDYMYFVGQPAASSHAGSFATQLVVIASGDADKTIIVKQKSQSASNTGIAFISAIRAA
jgi:hypothetical protein